MFEINIEFKDSFYNKTNPENYINAFQDMVEFTTDTLVNECKSEAPVRTGNLRDGHYSRIENLSGHVYNDVEYAKYVIYGTSRQAPNNYPQRVLNRMNPSTYTSRFHSSLITRGVL